MSANRSFVQDRLRAMPVSAERKKAAEAHREAGVLSYQKGSYDKALTDFRAAISKNPTLTQLLSYTSNCLAKLGQHTEEVLAELGYSNSEITRLAGVHATTAPTPPPAL